MRNRGRRYALCAQKRKGGNPRHVETDARVVADEGGNAAAKRAQSGGSGSMRPYDHMRAPAFRPQFRD